MRIAPLLGTLLLATPGAMLSSSCAVPASSGNMTVRPGDLIELTSERQPRAGSLALEVHEVTGGAGTNPMKQSEIAAADFAQALKQSLQLVGLHTGPGLEPLPLRADLLRFEHPRGDQDAPVYITVRYRIGGLEGEDLLFDRTIRTGDMVPMRASPGIKGRGRAALEGAARVNIATFLGDLTERGLGVEDR